MNLKLETCRNCPTKCVFGQEVGATLIRFRRKSAGAARKRTQDPKLVATIVFASRDNLSKNLQAANKRGCPASEIKRLERIALRQIAPSIANTKAHGRLVNPTAATFPFKAGPSSIEHSLK